MDSSKSIEEFSTLLGSILIFFSLQDWTCKYWDCMDFKSSFISVWNVSSWRVNKMIFILTPNPTCTCTCTTISAQEEPQIGSVNPTVCSYVEHFILTTWSWWTVCWWHCSEWACLCFSMSLRWGIRYGVLLIAFWSRWSRAPSVHWDRRHSPRGTLTICSNPPLSSHITPWASIPLNVRAPICQDKGLILSHPVFLLDWWVNKIKYSSPWDRNVCTDTPGADVQIKLSLLCNDGPILPLSCPHSLLSHHLLFMLPVCVCDCK